MAITRRSIGSVLDDFGTSFELSKPAGLADDDFVVICGYISNNTTSLTIESPSEGWTEDTEAQSSIESDSTTFFYYKYITNAAGEPSTWTLSGLGASLSVNAVAIAYTGVDSSTPVDATTTTNVDVTNSDTYDPPAIITQTDGAFVITAVGAINGDGVNSPGITQPSGYTKLAETGTTHYLGVAEEEVATAGSPGEDPGTWSGLGTSADSGGLTLAIRPASGSTGNPRYYYAQQQ